MFTESDAARTRRRFAWIVTLALVVAVGSVVVLEVSYRLAEQGARAVNLCGRQRMLAAQVGQLSAQLVLGDRTGNPSLLRSLLRQTADELRSVHWALLYGDPARGLVGVGSPGVQALYSEAGLGALNERLQGYVRAAHALAAGAPEALSADNPDYLHVRATSRKVVDALDRLTAELERAAVRDIERAAWSGRALLVLILALMLGLWRYIYVPARRPPKDPAAAPRRGGERQARPAGRA